MFKMHSIIIDIGYPMDKNTLDNILTALKNVLALSWCAKMHNDSHFLYVTVVNSDVQAIGTYALRGDFRKIETLLTKIKTSAKTNWKLSVEDYEDYLLLAIRQTMNEYKKQVSISLGDNVIPPGGLRIAVISSKRDSTVRRGLQSIRRTLINPKIGDQTLNQANLNHDIITSLTNEDEIISSVKVSAIQVIDTSGETYAGSRYDPKPKNDPKQNTDDWIYPKMIVEKVNTIAGLQDELKRLLLVPDPQVIKLIIPASAQTKRSLSDAVDDSGTLLVCQATPVAIDPNDLPNSIAKGFLISTQEENEDKQLSSDEGPFKKVKNKKESAIHCFLLKCRISYEGICDGSTFGMPYYLSPLTPPTAIQANYTGCNTPTDFQKNSQMFWALHQKLTDREEVLLTSLETDDLPVPAPTGNFLIYTGGDCLLLQALRSTELALPANIESSVSFPHRNVNVTQPMEDKFNGIPHEDVYNASKFPTGVFPFIIKEHCLLPFAKPNRKRKNAQQTSQILQYLKQS